MTRRIIGCMTGTSIDGIDAALVEIDGTGLSMKPRFIRGLSSDLGPTREPLRKLADQHPMTAADIGAAMHDFSLLHIKVIRELLNGEKCDLIAVHGQTVFHKPPLSWQLMQPAPLARELNTPVVFDMRAMDLAAGGQGAPITPIADWILFRCEAPTAIINLGGFCNITVLPASTRGAPSQFPELELSRVRALDVCPCNHLLDAISRTLFDQPFDAGGARALQGKPNRKAADDLDRIFASQSGHRRSLGTGDESLEWISRWRTRVDPNDLAATACQAIGNAITTSAEGAELLLAMGGGAKNAALIRAMQESCIDVVQPWTGDLGTYREAICFAVLGALCQDRTPITLPQVTGVPPPAPISGAWVLP